MQLVPINASAPQLEAHGAHVRSVVVVGAAVSYSLAPHTVTLVHCRSLATVHGPEMNVPDGQVVEHASHERSDAPWHWVLSKNPGRHSSEHRTHCVSAVALQSAVVNQPSVHTLQFLHVRSAVALHALARYSPTPHAPEHAAQTRSAFGRHACASYLVRMIVNTHAHGSASVCQK